MKGFKEFLMRGNLVQLAVAVIIGGVFSAVVKSFTDMIMDVIGKVGAVPDFSQKSIAGIHVGAFLSAVLAFLLTAFVVYFFVVLPYNTLSARMKKEETAAVVVAPTTEDLLAEIRDILREQTPAGS
jgi:large conductance mechanosensitive channel